MSTHQGSPAASVCDRRTFLAATSAAAAVASAIGSAPARAAAADAGAAALERIKQILAGADPATWVLTGDSITHGALHTLGWRSYPEHFAERVRWELRRMRDVVINTGISGDRTGGLLADFDWRVARFQPQVASIMLGMNDCRSGADGREAFRQNLGELVQRSADCGAVPLLHTPNTVYVKNCPGREDLPAYVEIVRQVAADKAAPLVDHWTYWQEQKPDQEALLAWLEDQSLHPGVYGHRAFARAMFQTLGIFDAASPTCALEVP
jgi:lysophospholipase L1-like esterase